MADDGSANFYGDVDIFTWARSSIGNAYFSGVSYEQLWEAVSQSITIEQLDAAIDASERLNLLMKGPPKQPLA